MGSEIQLSIVGNKLDLPGAQEELERLRGRLAAKQISVSGISAATGEGLQELARRIADLLAQQRRAQETDDADGAPAEGPDDESTDA